CDANLVDDVIPSDDAEPPRSSARPEASGNHLTYELEGWGNQLKVTLEGMLDRAGIARVWEAGALVVPAVHEADVDSLIATLEGGDVADVEDDLPRVALEIEGLDADRQADLDAQLMASGLAYAWDDEGDLVVLDDDEEAVLIIIGDVLDDEADDDDSDPLAGQAALSDLFVAVDRLVKKPGDPALARPVGEAVSRFDGLAVPYGFSGADWDALVAEGRDLVRLIDPTEDDQSEASDDEPDGDHPGDVDDDQEVVQDTADQVALQAQALRDRLSDLV
ncbi:MAG: hypothetical protein ABI239_10120, partial [Aquihabitans sp.]